MNRDLMFLPAGIPVAKDLSAKQETLLRCATIQPGAAVLARRKARGASATARRAQGR